MDDSVASKETLKYKEECGKYNGVALGLLEGRPGGGKTTPVHRVTQRLGHKRVCAED